MRYLGKDQEVQSSLKSIKSDGAGTQITVIDPDQINQKEPSQIIVGKGIDNRELMNLIVDRGARHVVQMPNLDFIRQMNFCANVLSHPGEFFENPQSFLVELGDRSLINMPMGIFHYPTNRFLNKDYVLEALRRDLEGIPRGHKILDPALIVADEMLMNILKDAPMYFQKNFPNLDPKGRTSSLTIAFDHERLLLWTEDDYGSLSVDKMINRLRECYQSEQIDPLMQDGQGAGLGCRIIFDTSVSMSVFVKPGKKTVFCAMLPLGLSNRQREGLPKNLQILALTF